MLMRKYICAWLKWLGKLALCILAGTALLGLVYALPTGPMQENVARSSEIFNREGIFPELAYGYSCMRLDTFTDSVMLGTAIYGGEETLLERMMLNYRMGCSQLAEDMTLTNYANRAAVYEFYPLPYGRYWHGYLVPLKLLLLFFDFGDIRVLNFIAQSILFGVVVWLFWKNKQETYLPAFAMSIFLMNPLAIALSLQFSTVYYIVLAASICLLFRYQKGKQDEEKINNLFFFTGIATSYFDFLTYPFVSAGIPLLLYLNLNGESIGKKQVKSCILKLFLWGAGYGGMWGGKWLVGSLLTGENFFRNAWNQSLLRTSVEDYTRIGVVLKNIGVFFKWPFVLLFTAVVIFCFLKLRKGSWAVWYQNRWKILLYGIIALLPLLWICVLANHSWIHYWYTYRELSISSFAVLSTAAYLSQPVSSDT